MGGQKRPAVALACGASESYAPYLTVSLHSALRRLDPCRDVRVFVMDGGLSKTSLNRLHRILAAAHPSVDVTVVKPDRDHVAGLPTRDRYPIATYFRLIAPALMPESVKRLLYFDADVLVTEDVSPVFDLDMGGKPVWAALDSGDGTRRGLPRLRQAVPNLAAVGDFPILNAGVMLIDCAAWRRRRIGERTMEVIQVHRESLRYWDQDALNVTLAGDWGRLEPRWNNFTRPNRDPLRELQAGVHREGILHFFGREKPWHWSGRCPREAAYYAAIVETGWHSPLERARLETVRAFKRFRAWIVGVLGREPVRRAGRTLRPN